MRRTRNCSVKWLTIRNIVFTSYYLRTKFYPWNFVPLIVYLHCHNVIITCTSVRLYCVAYLKMLISTGRVQICCSQMAFDRCQLLTYLLTYKVQFVVSVKYCSVQAKVQLLFFQRWRNYHQNQLPAPLRKLQVYMMLLALLFLPRQIWFSPPVFVELLSFFVDTCTRNICWYVSIIFFRFNFITCINWQTFIRRTVDEILGEFFKCVRACVRVFRLASRVNHRCNKRFDKNEKKR